MSIFSPPRSDFVYDLFEHMTLAPQGGGGRGHPRQPTMLKSRGNVKPSRKKATVSSQFKESLHSLMQTLGQANPYFVRCIKPNGEKVADKFVPQTVLNQLKYSGESDAFDMYHTMLDIGSVFPSQL